MPAMRSGEWLDPDSGLGLGLEDVQPGTFSMTIPTDRYTSREYALQERNAIWKRVWQIVGRAEDLPMRGDWKKYDIQDQSFVIVRGKDAKLRGFVNACRHRGNALCIKETGNAKLGFLCQYHLWSYDLEGKLRSMLREDLVGPIDKTENSLLEVAESTRSPDSSSSTPTPRLRRCTSSWARRCTAFWRRTRSNSCTTVMDVQEALDCNWKVVMDAFEEGYHINGIHPQLLAVIEHRSEDSRYQFFENHSVAVAPFEVQGAGATRSRSTGSWRCRKPSPARDRGDSPLPGTRRALPGKDGEVEFPDGVTARTLLQQATRDILTGMGLDVSGLTDDQMSDNQGWVLFPNFFMTVRAGECHVIMAVPHPDGDPNRCIWHVSSYMLLPPEHRDAFRAEPIVVRSPEATNTSRRFTRTTCKCRASNLASATTGSTICRW